MQEEHFISTVLDVAEDVARRRAARAARDASEKSQNALRRFAQWYCYRLAWWWWDLSWMVTTHFGSDGKPSVSKWTNPLLESYIAGAWTLVWTEEVLYWIAKPAVVCEKFNLRKRLHCEDGPALICDIQNLYFWHGVLVPAYAITNPEWITIDEISSEQNAEVRRALIERMTPEKYLWESKASLLDVDHEKCRKGSAPRALLADNQGDKWLVGTDGSTKRVYYMPVPDDVKTCREAHIAICGFDESRILSKS